mgnify:CR=1 FL=1
MTKEIDYKEVFEHLNNIPIVAMAGLRVRPGTDFFHSLVDGHPEIVQTTGSCLYNYFSFWNATIYKDDLDNLIEEFIYDINHIPLFDSRFNMKEKWGKLGGNKDEYFEVDKLKFTTYLKNLMNGIELNSKNFFLALNGAYSMCVGIDIFKSKVLFFHAHSVENIYPISNEFSNITVVLMIRELREGTMSFIENKSITDPSYYMPSSCVNPFKEYALINEYTQKFNTKFISLKDLHHNPQKVLINFCQDFELEFIDNILMTSDYHGKLWWGDVLSQKDLQGFNPKFGRIEKWKDKFNNIDSALIEFLFSEEYKIFNFETSISNIKYNSIYILFPLLVFVPMKYEVKLLKYNIKNKMGLRRIISSFVFYLVRIKMYFKVYFLKLTNKKIEIRKY